MNPPSSYAIPASFVAGFAVSFTVTVALGVAAVACSVWLTRSTLRLYREALRDAAAAELGPLRASRWGGPEADDEDRQ